MHIISVCVLCGCTMYGVDAFLYSILTRRHVLCRSEYNYLHSKSLIILERKLFGFMQDKGFTLIRLDNECFKTIKSSEVEKSLQHNFTSFAWNMTRFYLNYHSFIRFNLLFEKLMLWIHTCNVQYNLFVNAWGDKVNHLVLSVLSRV